MRITQLIQDLSDAEHRGPDPEIKSIVFDSRAARSGSLFVAIDGEDLDGHDFVDSAVEAGCVAVILERNMVLPSSVARVQVADSRSALSHVARRFFGHADERLGLIGVTGTDGKTTTSSLIAAILDFVGINTGFVTTASRRVGDIDQINEIHQTTPSSLELQSLMSDMANHGKKWAILETTSHGLAQKRVEGFAFNRAIYTRITHEHLEYHKSYKAYIEAKALLLDLVASSPVSDYGKVAVLNADDGAYQFLRERARVPVMSYSRFQSADLQSSQSELLDDGIAFTLDSPWGRYRVRVPLQGAFNIENCLAAIACVGSLGVPVESALEALSCFAGVPGRMEQIDVGQPFKVLVDYAHTPAGLSAVLDTVRALTGGRVIIVFGSAGERDTQKRPIMGRIAAESADHTIITMEDPRGEEPDSIATQILDGFGESKNKGFVEVIHDRRQAIRHACSIALPKDTVVFAGKGHEKTMIIKNQNLPWDEVSIVSQALSELGYDG